MAPRQCRGGAEAVNPDPQAQFQTLIPNDLGPFGPVCGMYNSPLSTRALLGLHGEGPHLASGPLGPVYGCASPLLRLGPARVCTGRGKARPYSVPLGSAYGCARLLLRLGPARVCTGRGHASTRTRSGPRRSVHVFSFDSGPLGSVRGGATLRLGPVWARVRGVQVLSFDSGPPGSVRGGATLSLGPVRARTHSNRCLPCSLSGGRMA